MEEKNNISINFNLGIWGVCFIILFLLKVFEVGAVASWSWWWILAPLWIPVALIVSVFIVFFLIRAIVLLISSF